jgi:MFS family permease
MAEVTAFWFGASFIATRTILPVYVSQLTDSEFAIGLLATIVGTGWLLPQLFTANWVQRLPVKKIVPVRVGLYAERLPVLLLVPAAWLAIRSPELALIVFFILISWHIFGAGTIAVGWQDMLAKIFPVERRGRFFGLANFSGTATGVLGAAFAGWLLDRYEFPYGYVLCFAMASIFILVSWIFLALTREPAVEPEGPPLSQREHWRTVPQILSTDLNYRRYLISQLVIAAGGMAVGFMAVYAVQRWNLPDSQAGSYTIAMLLGQAPSNLAFGWLADRRGHKLVLEISALATVLSAVLACVAPAAAWFYLVFVLTGVSTAGFILSGLMIVFEFSDAGLRPTYIGLNATVIGIFAAATPLVGSWLAASFGYRVLFIVAAVFSALGLVLLRWWVTEPRLPNREV